ncbi:NinB protein [compost metagenome]
MARHLLKLTPGQRDNAHGWVEKALHAWQPGAAFVMEIREPTRSDEQNRALWSLLGQIQKARPVHNGVQMDTETWKCLFMHALGREVRFVPTLDGSSMLPLGLRSSKLTKREFSDLIELILAWCAVNEVEVQHFDAANDDGTSEGRAAA